MNTLSEILTQSYNYQGIQDLKVFYDSLVFNLKIEKDSKYYNLVLLEKTSFDYNTETISKVKNGLTVNFGDTESPNSYTTSGNYFIDSFLDNRYKNVLLVGTRKMTNGNTIPVIFYYNINSHSTKTVFPLQENIDEFNSFSNYTFLEKTLPIAKLIKNKLYIVFQTNSNGYTYLNKFTFTVYKDKIKLGNYEVYKYDESKKIILKDVMEKLTSFKFGDYKGIFQKLKEDEFNYDPFIFSFSDFNEIMALDDSNTVLLADYSEKILKNSVGLIGA
jgi:hypothetical protein